MSVGPHPHNPGQWIIDCRPGGYKGPRERIPFVGTRQEAVDLERVIMRRHIDAPDPTPRQLSAIFLEWLVYYRANRAEKTVGDAKLCWTVHLAEKFGKILPKHITRATIEQYKAGRIGEGVKHRTVNKELSYLSSMLKWAAANDYCEPMPFPISGFNRKLTAPPRPRPLTAEQISLVYSLIEPEYRLVFLLMADAGLRRSEAMQLQRSAVEFDHGILFVTGKGNKERIVPITTDRLMEELRDREGMTGYLTVNPGTKRPYLSIRKALLRAAEKAGLGKHLYHHLLRHSFGTVATIAGYDLSALQSIMGHSSPSTTGIYQHMAGDYLRNQGRKLNDMVKTERPHGQCSDTPQKHD
ncbi:MAG: tyrosine-type recombinase/integrase [Desulfobulbaceae bacterium]|nr:tyrosine-type recombinase/integrase [Desulfobulbaceae bacterium]